MAINTAHLHTVRRAQQWNQEFIAASRTVKQNDNAAARAQNSRSFLGTVSSEIIGQAWDFIKIFFWNSFMKILISLLVVGSFLFGDFTLLIGLFKIAAFFFTIPVICYGLWMGIIEGIKKYRAATKACKHLATHNTQAARSHYDNLCQQYHQHFAPHFGTTPPAAEELEYIQEVLSTGRAESIKEGRNLFSMEKQMQSLRNEMAEKDRTINNLQNQVINVHDAMNRSNRAHNMMHAYGGVRISNLESRVGYRR